MKKLALAAAISLFAFAGAAHGESSDGDGVADAVDNCSEHYNPSQDDTDGDACGNICDADYNQDGVVSFGDFGYFTGQCFGTDNPVCDHTEPIGDGVVGFGDFGRFTSMFGSVPGPSGPTTGTIACP